MEKENRPQYSAVYKLTLVGESGVGKSSMLSRFADDKCLSSHIATIGVDFKVRSARMPTHAARRPPEQPPQVRTIQLDSDVVKLQLWDTAGQERFRTITTAYYRGSHGVIVCFDLTRPESFEQVKYWLSEVERHTLVANVLLVGTKSDLVGQRRVSAGDAQALADELKLDYVESSALHDVNVHQAFLQLACSVKKRLDAERLARGEKPKLNLKSEPAASSSTWLASLCPRSLYGA